MKSSDDLTWKDVYIVRAGRYLTTWSGETISLVVVGCQAEQIPIWGNHSDATAKICLCPSDKNVSEFAKELGGVDCTSFLTPKIQAILNSQSPDTIK